MTEEDKDKDDSYLKDVLRHLRGNQNNPSPEEELKRYEAYRKAFARAYGWEMGKQQAKIDAMKQKTEQKAELERIKTEEQAKRRINSNRGRVRVEWTEQGYGMPFPEEYIE